MSAEQPNVSRNDAGLDDLLVQRLDGLRQNLLDLSNRNRLLSFKHSERARTHIRVIDELPDVLFQRLRDGRQLQFKSLPEPEGEPPEERSDLFLMELEAARATHEGYAEAMAALRDDELNSTKAAEIERALRDDVRATLGLPPWADERLMSREDFARESGLEPGYDLPWQTEDAEQAQRHADTEVQTLLLPSEMDRKLSGIVDQARTMLQEAGVNTLYVAFGFLEYFEAGSAERKHLAPLLLLPVQIDRGMAKPWRRYRLSSDGGEIEVNETLAIRLRDDFGYQMPEFADDETPETYLRKIDRHISSQPRWRVRRFVTVGHFGFSKLPMYNDLSTVMWRESRRLEEHDLVRQLVLGAEESDASMFAAEDYDIDAEEVEARDLTLIADADASQHSAIVDVIDGRDLIIQGPPGTGKSQTITNIIAALLAHGKSVLFVAEKFAALSVVHARLRHAHLDDFCLQVHSNKTPRSSVLNALKKRIEVQNAIAEPKTFGAQVEELKTCRDRLNTYAAQMNLTVGRLGMTVQQLLWAERHARLSAAEGCEVAGDLLLDGIEDVTPLARSQSKDAIREMFSRLNGLKAAYGSKKGHPWSWVEWCESGPFAEEEFRRRTSAWLASLAALGEARDALRTDYGCSRVTDFDVLQQLAEGLSGLPQAQPQPVPALARAIWEDDLSDAVRALLDGFAECPQDGGQSHVVEPVGRVPTDRSWKRLGESVDSAMQLLSQEASDVETLGDAQEYAAELRQIASLVERGVRLAHAVQDTARLPRSSTQSSLTMALSVLKHALALPQESLVVRNPELLSPDAELALTEAVQTADSLRRSRDLLEKVFVLRPVPDIYDVNIHARALRKAGTFSWFDSEIKQAKEFFKSIANTNKRVSHADMATLLGRLESYLDARITFEHDSQLSALCGNWFKGEETDFERFLDLEAWQREVARGLPRADADTAVYREMLLTGSYDLLSELRSTASSLDLDTAIEEVGSLADEVESIEEELASAFHKVAGIERACAELADAGVASRVRFGDIASVMAHMRKLDDLRIAARSADETSQTVGLAIEQLREVQAYLDHVGAMGVPRELKARLAARCRESELKRMREHGDDIARLLAAAAQSYRRLYQDDDGEPLADLSMSDVEGNLDGLISRIDLSLKNPGDLAGWIDYLHARRRASEGGLEIFVSKLEEAEVSSECAEATHDWLVYRSLARAAYETIPGLSQMSGVSVAQLRKKFQALDREILELQQQKLSADLCRRPIAQGNGVGKKSSYTELSLIRHEIAKKRRHVPLRDLFSRSSRALQQMKPCLMMSPLSVATFLQPGQAEFDVVIIDEASQMPLEDALGAIARARQCVIVGDDLQLPPTTFFKRFEDVTDDDGTENEDLDVESVLDQGMNVFRPPRSLRWHYRSQHQDLIAFSNKHFYDGRLTIFPSFREQDPNFGVRTVKVDGRYADRRNLTEVEEITAWACKQMKSMPERSLGIVAVNQLQRDLIRDEMDRMFQRDAEAEAYRKRWETTLYPFFVKNLENVQGDERDVIAISTVYGPNEDGRVAQNFGPISTKYGHRRLNVLFTRARQQVVLFTSLTPNDIQIRETTGPGPRALRGYLEFAQSSRLDPDWLSHREPESDFELVLADRLSSHGFDVVPKVGVSGYFIDIGVRHRDFPGQFLLGVECDGATYFSAKSARDRDRLREEVLKGQGWILYRIWSTDWFRDPDGETRKLVGFIETHADQRRERLKTLTDRQSSARTGHAVDAECVASSEPGASRREHADRGRYNDNADAVASNDEADGDDPADPADAACCVGDTVVFHYEDDPDEAVSVTVVLGESDIGQGTISRMSPIGDALVGASPGDDLEVYLSDGMRTIIVDEVRKEKAALSG